MFIPKCVCMILHVCMHVMCMQLCECIVVCVPFMHNCVCQHMYSCVCMCLCLNNCVLNCVCVICV